MSADKPDRPSGLILKDITIRNRAENNENEQAEQAQESKEKENMKKPDLFAGLFSDNAQSGNADNYEMVSVSKLDPFFDHPFNPYPEEEMNELVESVKMLGVEEPLIVRKKDNGRYEILAGHNRCEAAKRAGLRTVPCKIKDVNDDTARLIVTDTNLKQRKTLSYSEKARAYKMQLEALKRQGKRRDLIEAVDQENNFGQSLPEVKNARDIVAERNKTSARKISMYIRLLELNDGLLDKVDTGKKVPFVAGVELSYLSDEMQDKVNALLDTFEKLTITTQAAETLRSMDTEELSCLSGEDIINILSGKPLTDNTGEPKPKKFTPFKTAFKAAEKQFKKIDRYTVESIDEKELEKIVIDAVEDYLIRKRQ